jgi:phage shock protein A
MEWLIGLGVLALAAFLLFGTQGGRNMLSALRAQWGKAGRAAKGADPLANYQQTVDDAAEQVKNAKTGMTRAVALINSVERQVVSGKKEKARLEARIQIALDEGNQDKAQHYALQLGDCEKNLKENEGQLTQHKEAYQGFVNDVKRQQTRVEDAQRQATNLGVRLEMSKANREFHEFQAGFTTSNGALSKLDKEREAVEQQIDTNNAYQQVEKDVGGNKYDETDDEVDRKLAAAEVLKRFQKPVDSASNVK